MTFAVDWALSTNYLSINDVLFSPVWKRLIIHSSCEMNVMQLGYFVKRVNLKD